VALLIDYVVTVAVQTAAGSAAIVSAFPALSRIPVIGPKILLVISVLGILVMCLGNLRGIREAGRIFALPTYLFAAAVVAMIVTGVVRELTGGLPRIVPGHGTVAVGSHAGLIAFGAIYIMARAFANGGSSLTGIEAVSNAVSALRPPEGRHARQILATQGSIVAVLIAGISWLAHVTHAMPYTAQPLPLGRPAAGRQLRPRHHRRAQVRQEPAPAVAVRRALQPGQRPGRPAARTSRAPARAAASACTAWSASAATAIPPWSTPPTSCSGRRTRAKAWHRRGRRAVA
jgi:hypothetical protein